MRDVVRWYLLFKQNVHTVNSKHDLGRSDIFICISSTIQDRLVYRYIWFKDMYLLEMCLIIGLANGITKCREVLLSLACISCAMLKMLNASRIGNFVQTILFFCKFTNIGLCTFYILGNVQQSSYLSVVDRYYYMLTCSVCLLIYQYNHSHTKMVKNIFIHSRSKVKCLYDDVLHAGNRFIVELEVKKKKNN